MKTLRKAIDVAIYVIYRKNVNLVNSIWWRKFISTVKTHRNYAALLV